MSILAKTMQQAAPLLLILLTGCGNDRPVYGPPPATPPDVQTAPSTGPEASAPSTGPEASASSPPADPLAGDAGAGQPTDPFLASDPFQGKPMPTQHSHWLRGYVRNAHLTVFLNSMRLGTFYGPLDRDITMRLRKGSNSVTFIYQPGAANSATLLEIVEGEHDPPIAPLVSFQPAPAAGDGQGKPLTKIFRFIAN